MRTGAARPRMPGTPQTWPGKIWRPRGKSWEPPSKTRTRPGERRTKPGERQMLCGSKPKPRSSVQRVPRPNWPGCGRNWQNWKARTNPLRERNSQGTTHHRTKHHDAKIFPGNRHPARGPIVGPGCRSCGSCRRTSPCPARTPASGCSCSPRRPARSSATYRPGQVHLVQPGGGQAVDKDGIVRAVGDGEAVSHRRAVQGHKATAKVNVSQAKEPFTWTLPQPRHPDADAGSAATPAPATGLWPARAASSSRCAATTRQTDHFVLTRQALGRRVDRRSRPRA